MGHPQKKLKDTSLRKELLDGGATRLPVSAGIFNYSQQGFRPLA
jgi:hypothetical protein